MIKILNIISDSNIGGAGRCVLNYLKYCDRKNFDVKVVVPKGSLLAPEIKKLDIPVIEVDAIADKSFDLKAIGKLNKIIKSENPDIVHTHGAVSGRISARLCGKKIVYTRHSVFPVNPKIKKGIGRFINKSANEFLSDDIIAVAEAAKENLTDGGIAPDKIKVILNGVEKVERLSDDQIKKAREKYSINEGDFVLGILARLEPVKGHKYLLEATEILKNKGRKVKVIIAGVGSSENELKKLAEEKDLLDTVIFAGFVKDVKELLSVINLQINASYGTEATSLALLEGMSLGIPAVVSDYGGNPGVITHGENGYIFKLKDSGDLAYYIERLMDDTKTYEYMKKRSQDIFESKFTAEIYAKNIENIYYGLLKKGAR